MKRNWNVVRKILELVEEGKLKDYIEEKRYRDEFSINSPDDGAPNDMVKEAEISITAVKKPLAVVYYIQMHFPLRLIRYMVLNQQILTL